MAGVLCTYAINAPSLLVVPAPKLDTSADELAISLLEHDETFDLWVGENTGAPFGTRLCFPFVLLLLADILTSTIICYLSESYIVYILKGPKVLTNDKIKSEWLYSFSCDQHVLEFCLLLLTWWHFEGFQRSKAILSESEVVFNNMDGLYVLHFLYICTFHVASIKLNNSNCYLYQTALIG